MILLNFLQRHLKIVSFNLKWVLNPYRKHKKQKRNTTTGLSTPSAGYHGKLQSGGEPAEDEEHSEELRCKATIAAAIWVVVLRPSGR